MLHPAWTSPIGVRKRSRAQDALQRIAETLHMSADVLRRHAQRDAYPDPAAELVRLWFKIPSQERRAAIMRVIRDAADEASLKRT